MDQIVAAAERHVSAFSPHDLEDQSANETADIQGTQPGVSIEGREAVAVTGTIDVGTAELYYREAGGGTPLLLIAGGTGDADSWFGSFDRLAERHRVIAYDRRGHTRSSGPPSSDLHQHAEDAARLLARLEATPATIVGWSMGGVIALDLAIGHPELVRSLVLIEPPLHAKSDFDPGFLLTFAKVMLLRRIRGDRAAAVAFKRFVDGASWDRLPGAARQAMLKNSSALMADLDAGTGEHLTRVMIEGLKVPVLLLYGSESPPALHRPVQRLSAWLPDAEVQLVPGAGHLMQFDRPAEFESAVLRAAG